MEPPKHSILNKTDLENFVVNLTDCINSFYELINSILIETVNLSGEVNDIQFNSNYFLNS